ncbi:MAG: type II secretion system protein [Candidatus Omnitrophica bacterium]|nr:type II secretion system protein [Candidatus Omnitrophota bacterium]
MKTKFCNVRECGNYQKSGFTLIELLFVVLIIAILVAVVVPNMLDTGEAAKSSANHNNIASINRQVERWYVYKEFWPADDLSDIGKDVEYFPEGIPVCPIDGKPYFLDEFTHRVKGHER